MTSNLPTKSIDKILSTPDKELSEHEKALKKQLMGEVDRQEKDESAYEPQVLQIEVAHSAQLFSMPDGTSGSEIDVAIAGSVITRAMYSEEDAEGKSKCFCTSLGGKVGNATEYGPKDIPPNHPCATCKYNQFGTALKGKGKACKEKRKLLCFHPNVKQGMTLNISSTSTQAYDSYFQSFVTQGKVFSAYWHNISLTKGEKGPQKWSYFHFKESKMLDAALFTQVMEVRKRFQDALSTVDDVEPSVKYDDDIPV